MQARAQFPLVSVLLLSFALLSAAVHGEEPEESLNLNYRFSNREEHVLKATTYGNVLGVEVVPAGESLRAQLDLDEEEKGVLVTNVHSLLRRGRRVRLQISVPELVLYKVVDLPARRDGHTVEVDRYSIGVALADADPTLQSQLGLEPNEGLVVTEVVANTPAANAGVRVHDILIALDGKRMKTVETLEAQLQEIKEREVELTLLRHGRKHRFKVTPRHGHYTYYESFFFGPQSAEPTSSAVDAAEEIVVKLRAALAELEVSLERLERAVEPGEEEEAVQTRERAVESREAEGGFFDLNQ